MHGDRRARGGTTLTRIHFQRQPANLRHTRPRHLRHQAPSRAAASRTWLRLHAGRQHAGTRRRHGYHQQQPPTLVEFRFPITIGQQTIVPRFTKPRGNTCCKNRRMNSSADSVITFCR